MAKAEAIQKVTREAYETAVQMYVHCSNQVSVISAMRDKEVERLNKKYDPLFADHKENMEGAFLIVKQYCEDNKGELFQDVRSIVEYSANIGFREGKDKVVILEG